MRDSIAKLIPRHFWKRRRTSSSFPLEQSRLTEITTNEEQARQHGHEHELSRTHNWFRFGLRVCCLTIFLILLINVILLVTMELKYGVSDGLGTLVDGSFEKTRRLDLWLHLLINILGTILLASSNYSMQIVTAPTRDDIDKAHASYDWMDIGIPSVRNLWRISWLRKILWFFLFVSSIPLHLVYNSAIISNTSYSDYKVFIFTQGLVNNVTLAKIPDYEALVNLGPTQLPSSVASKEHMRHLFSSLHTGEHVERLTNEDCVAKYGSSTVSKWGDVMLITSDQVLQDATASPSTTPEGSSSVEQGRYVSILDGPLKRSSTTGLPFIDNSWICNYRSHCDLNTARRNATGWRVNGHPILYCLRTKVSETCQLQFNEPILSTVIICNSIKLICLVLLLHAKYFEPLVTLGDAIASFLDRPGK